MDFRQIPPEVQALITQEVTEAAKVHQANKTPKAKAKRKAKGKGEVTKLQLRQFAKQFRQAKMDEFKSWQEENHVYEIVDMRKHQCRNYVTGRWVLPIKRDKDGNFEKRKARWVLRGFLDKQGNTIQTDSPTATRPGFRLTCQVAAIKYWDLGHVDLKTPFL